MYIASTQPEAPTVFLFISGVVGRAQGAVGRRVQRAALTCNPQRGLRVWGLGFGMWA